MALPLSTTRSRSAPPSPANEPDRRITARILAAVGFSFVCYLTIGMLLAILPSYVHLRLGLSTVVAGLVVSAQYVATVLSRPHAGRMTDVLGPKRTVLYGLLACAGSGAFSLLAAWTEGVRGMGLGSLVAGRLLLGVGESLVATGATMWGIGRVGYRHTARVISWNGIATYGALAAGAPLGVALQRLWGLASVGAFVVLLSLGSAAVALRVGPAAVVHGERMPFRRILWRVAPHGLGLALGGVGFGVIAAFVTLYYAQRGWPGAALALSVYGACFIGARLLLSGVIPRLGGFPVAAASFAVEAAGLALLGLAPTRHLAFAGAAVTGFGFSLVFPALGVEAVRHVPAESRGTALGAYTAFVDLSLFVSGPAAGAVIGGFGYPAAFMSAAGAGALALALTLWLAKRDTSP